MENDFNKNHPERLEDEVFITNATDEKEEFDKKSSYDAVGWATKRRGLVAYDKKGNLSDWRGAFPVFVKQSEIEKSENGKEILERLLPQ